MEHKETNSPLSIHVLVSGNDQDIINWIKINEIIVTQTDLVEFPSIFQPQLSPAVAAPLATVILSDEVYTGPCVTLTEDSASVSVQLMPLDIFEDQSEPDFSLQLAIRVDELGEASAALISARKQQFDRVSMEKLFMLFSFALIVNYLENSC
jgi:hypothetical protein